MFVLGDPEKALWSTWLCVGNDVHKCRSRRSLTEDRTCAEVSAALRCPWGCTLSAAFAEDRKTNIHPASPAAHIWIRNCPNDRLNYLPAQVIRGSSYFSLRFCGADSFPQDGKHCLLLTAAPLSTGARAAGPCVLTEDRLTSAGFAHPAWCACGLPFVLPCTVGCEQIRVLVIADTDLTQSLCPEQLLFGGRETEGGRLFQPAWKDSTEATSGCRKPKLGWSKKKGAGCELRWWSCRQGWHILYSYYSALITPHA